MWSQMCLTACALNNAHYHEKHVKVRTLDADFGWVKTSLEDSAKE